MAVVLGWSARFNLKETGSVTRAFPKLPTRTGPWLSPEECDKGDEYSHSSDYNSSHCCVRGLPCVIPRGFCGQHCPPCHFVFGQHIRVTFIDGNCGIHDILGNACDAGSGSGSVGEGCQRGQEGLPLADADGGNYLKDRDAKSKMTSWK